MISKLNSQKAKVIYFANKNHKKILWFLFFSLVVMMIVLPTSALASFWEDDEDILNFLVKYKENLKYTKGGWGSVLVQSLTWGIVRGAYWICVKVEGLVPEALSLFSFVNGSGVNSVYNAVLNTIVVTLMILSLVIIGFKMITQKGSPDFKTVGMNVVMSITLILLMPTMITSGIQFAKTFYSDATSISKGDNGVAWKLIEDGVTDIVYINKQNGYDRLGKEAEKKNALKAKDFFVYDLGEIVTPDSAKDLESDNKNAKYLKYKLTTDGDGNQVAVKIDKSWMSVFSDSFKGGYYRYTKNTFSLVIGMVALSVAYLFSAFVIITAILELAFKRVLGVLVFATDLETGQRSKMVVSDVLSCYLTVGFQGLGMSFFALFITYLGSGGGASTNPILKAIAYVCAVFVLIKGSSTIMRYFGIDIGVSDGFGKISSTLALGSMALRNRKNGSSGKAEKGSTDSEPEKNFGASIQNRANRATQGLSYAKERGFKGLAKDGLESVGNQAKKPVEAFKTSAENLKNSANDGTAEAIKKNMTKSPVSKPEETGNNIESLDKTRISRKLPSENVGSTSTGNDEQKRSEAMKNQASVNEQMKQDIKQRIIKDSASETEKSREAFVRERMEKATANVPQTRSEMLKQQSESNNINDNERVKQARENLTRSVDLKENSHGSGSSVREQAVNLKENVQNASSGAREQAVNLKENVQSSGSGIREQVVQERVQRDPSASMTSQRNQIVKESTDGINETSERTQRVNIVEQRSNSVDSSDKVKNVTVKENIETGQATPINRSNKGSIEKNPLFSSNKKKNPFFD